MLESVPEEAVDGEQAGDAALGGDLVALVQAAKEPSSLRRKAGRAVNILRYYRASQLLQRAVRMAMPKVFRRGVVALPSEPCYGVRDGAGARFQLLAAARAVGEPERLATLRYDLANGRFTLLSQTCELGTPIDWHGRERAHPSRLWSFQLHYQEYLLELAVGRAEGNEDSWPVIWGIVADWIDGNRLEQDASTENAWHPYCISRRLPVWAQLLALGEPAADLRERCLHSFACQAEVLSKSLEFDLGGNHLLENLTALALAGAFLEGPRSEHWLDLATRHLTRQLPLQVLAHGEHYERAPMYHCQVLGNLLQVAYVTAGLRDELAGLCCETARGMHEFLHSILHPDGEIPLFGDSCWGEVHSVGEIDALAQLVRLGAVAEKTDDSAAGHLGGVEPQSKLNVQESSGKAPAVADSRQHMATLPTSGSANVVGPYWIWRDAGHEANGGDAFIFDGGPVGADDLPAHAHCDLLGFEASVGGERWFVDSGLFDYDDGAMRDYCRASAAHNVVTIANENCCDVWSRFRMGRRGRPTRLVHGRQGGFCWCEASHDGYRQLGVPKLSRLIVAHPSGAWVCLDHATTSANPSLTGRLHLAPGIKVRRLAALEQAGDLQPEGPQQPQPEQPAPQHLILTRGNIERRLVATHGARLGLAKGWYCDRFGQRTQTQVITYSPESIRYTGGTFGWSLTPAANAPSGEKLVTISTTGGVEVAIDGEPERFHYKFPQ